MVFHRSQSDSKSPQISRTFLSIQANFNIAVIWMVLIHSLIFNFSSPLSKPLRVVPSTPITTGITVTLMFHSFLDSPARSKYLSYFSLSLIFHCVSRWDGKIHNMASSLFFNYHLVWSFYYSP